MEQQKNRSRKATAVSADDWVIVRDEDKVDFVGYDQFTCDAEIIKFRKIKKGNKEQYQIVLNRTPFYAESGGQVGDTGFIETANEKIAITDTQKENNLIIHFADSLPLNVERTFIAKIDTSKRSMITKNHSATHLLHAALKQVLGNHVAQKGSMVNDEQTRFDFSHFAKVSDDEMAQIEHIVNTKVRENIALNEQRNVPIQQAKDQGATALFGEKYGDFVRVITFDKNYSVELCGGTHVKATGEIGYFKVIAESAVAAGVRRIEAISADKAEAFFNQQSADLHQVKTLLNNPKDIVKGVEQLLEENQKLSKQIELFYAEKAQGVKKELLNKIVKVGDINTIIQEVDLPADAIKNISFELKNQITNLYLVLVTANGGKPHLSIIISENLVADKGLNVISIIRNLAKEIQGGGGGQPFYATAGGKNADGIPSLLQKAAQVIGE
jgi:alanyl-tRNA synthetase